MSWPTVAAVVMAGVALFALLQLRRRSRRAESLQAIIDAMPQLLFAQDRRGVYTAVNAAALEANGNELLAKQDASTESVFASGQSVIEQHPLPCPDGSARIFETIKVPLHSNGAVAQVLGISADITERCAHERAEALRARETELLLEIYKAAATETDSNALTQRVAETVQTFFSTSTVGIWMLRDGDTHLEMCALVIGAEAAPGTRELVEQHFRYFPIEYDVPAAAAARKRAVIHVSRDDPGLPAELREAIDATGSTGVTALPIMARDTVYGALVFTVSTGRQLNGHDLRLLEGAVGVFGSTLQMMRLARQQRHHESELRLLGMAIEKLPDAVMIMDRNRIIRSINPAAAALAGTTATELLGKDFVELFDRPPFDDDVWRLTNGWSGERLLRSAAGGVDVPVAITWSPILDRLGNLQTSLAIVRDLTEEKERLRSAVQSDRLVSVGELAAGVAHEVNNPLTAISNFAELLLQNDLPSELRSDVAAIASEAHRAGSIVRNLLAFARQAPSHKHVADLPEVVEAVLNLKRYQLRAARIEVELTVDPRLPLVYVDPGQIQQVLHNVMTNARQSIQSNDDSGVIRVRIRRDGDWIELVIEDTGPGIPAGIAPKLFTPFFTTKQAGEGTGLGLPIVYGIVREHGGEVVVENWGRPRATGGSAGRGGARVTIRLPAAAPGSRRESPRVDVQPSAYAEHHRILIIEDEPLLARSVEKYLTRLGHKAVIALRAEDARNRIRRREDFDIIISDLRMPGMGGERFYEWLKHERPELAHNVIFSSGDIASRETHEFLEQTGCPVLAKPYDLKELRNAIERVGATRSRCS